MGADEMNAFLIRLEDSYDIRTIQERLGHADVKTNRIYTHALPRAAAVAYAAHRHPDNGSPSAPPTAYLPSRQPNTRVLGCQPGSLSAPPPLCPTLLGCREGI